MQKNLLDIFIDSEELIDCLEQLKNQPISKNQGLFRYKYAQNVNNDSNKMQSNENQDLIDLIKKQKSFNTQTFKRPQNHTLLDQENSSPFQSLGDGKSKQNKEHQKKQKQSKQCIYSKHYRDKKKQQFKALQEQNRFLKNKIQALHERIRELQIQNNRLKDTSQEKDQTVHQLNRQFMEKLSILGESIESNIKDKDQQQKSVIKKTRAELQKQFIDNFDEHGFSGTKRKLIFNYHINEIFQVLLRDSDKFFCMLCRKNDDESLKVQIPKYERINIAFFEIMQFKQEDQHKINQYLKFLFPAMKQIKKQCSDMYFNFEKIIKSLDRLHFIWKSTHVKNIDWVIKRMKIENWFEYHKYHKIMRELKAQWLDFIKNAGQMEDENFENCSNGYKKTKVSKKMKDE